MLRTLLLASRNQLKLYQSHSQTPKRLCVASPSAAVQNSTSKPVKRKDFGCQVDLAQTVVRDVQLNTAENHGSGNTCSQIKALLMGQEYERVQHCEVLEIEEPRIDCEASQAKKMCCEQKYTRNQEHDLSSFLCDVVDLISEYKDLTYSVQSNNSKVRSIEVRRRGLYGIPCPGMTPVQVVVEEDGTAHFITLVKIVFSVVCKDKDDHLISDSLLHLLQKLSIKGGHVFCPGVEAELALVAPATKNLICCDLLETRYQARECLVWHMLGHNQGWLPLNEGVHKCKACRALERYLRTLVKAKAKDNNEITTFG